MSSFSEDLSDSSFDFQRVVSPIIKPWVGGGELVLIEGSRDETLKTLDTNSGIDVLHICNGQVRGIANRIQWVDVSYRTFTVRCDRDSGTKTEYEKRREAIDSEKGYIYPSLTVQSYIAHPKRQGNLINLAMCRTSDLINICTRFEQGGIQNKEHVREGRTTNAGFIIIDWDFMKAEGLKISIFNNPEVF